MRLVFQPNKPAYFTTNDKTPDEIVENKPCVILYYNNFDGVYNPNDEKEMLKIFQIAQYKEDFQKVIDE